MTQVEQIAKRKKGRPRGSKTKKHSQKTQYANMEGGDETMLFKVKKPEPTPVPTRMQEVRVTDNPQEKSPEYLMEPPEPPVGYLQVHDPIQEPAKPQKREAPVEAEKISSELEWYLKNYKDSFSPQEFRGDAVKCDLLYANYCMSYHMVALLQELISEVKKR